MSRASCPVAVWMTDEWMPSGLRDVECMLPGNIKE